MPNIPTKSVFELPPNEAADYFRNRGLRISDRAATAAAQQAASQAFYIGGITDLGTLSKINKSIENSLRKGTGFRQFLNELPDGVALTRGRLRTVYDTAMNQALNAGQWAGVQRRVNRGENMWLRYKTVEDEKVRRSHRRLNDIILPATHPLWQRIYPVNDYNCRCSVIALSRETARAQGWRITARRAKDLDVDAIVPKSFQTLPVNRNQVLAADVIEKTQTAASWNAYKGERGDVDLATGFSSFIRGDIQRDKFPINYLPDESRAALNISESNALLTADIAGVERAIRALRRVGVETLRAQNQLARLAVSVAGSWTITAAGVLVLTRGAYEYRFVADGNRGYTLQTAHKIN